MLYNFRKRNDKNRKSRVADRYDDEKLIPLIPEWLRDEDVRLLLQVSRLRLSTIELMRITSGMSGKATYERLLRLKKGGFVILWARPAYRPKDTKNYHELYALSSKGAQVLALEASLPLKAFSFYYEQRPPNFLFANHVTDVARALIYLEKWVGAVGATAEQWTQESALRGIIGRNTFAIPDGHLLLRFHNGVVGHVFLEIDRGTERTAKAWHDKFDGYGRLLDSGRFTTMFNAGENAFTILVTTPNQKRATELARMCVDRSKPHMRPLFYFVPLDQFAQHNIFTESYCIRGDGLSPISFV